MIKQGDFVQGYLETALFADCPETSKHYRHGHFRPGDLGVSAFGKQAIMHAENARLEFLEKCGAANDDDLMSLVDTWDGGSDLWYTRNGHGVGFWGSDRGWGEYSDKLADAARAMGEVNLEMGRWITIH